MSAVTPKLKTCGRRLSKSSCKDESKGNVMNVSVFEYQNSAQGKQQARDIIRQIQESSPGAQLSFLVENYRTGSILEKQLSHARGSESEPTGGLELRTWLDVLQILAEQVDIIWTFQDFSESLSTEVQQSLFSDQEFGSGEKLMPGTVIAITNAVSNFKGVNLLDSTVFAALEANQMTPTAKKILFFAKKVQQTLADKEKYTPASLIASLDRRIDELKRSGVNSDIGNVLCMDHNAPESFINLLGKLLGPGKVTLLRPDWKDKSTEIEISEFLSFPDVFTEVRHGISRAVDYLVEAGDARDVAILYTDPQDYLTPLISALDDSGLEWYGPSNELVANSRLAILVKDVLEYASRPQEQYLDRKTIMRAIRSRILLRPEGLPDDFSWYKAERLIKNNGLFNNAEAWLPELDVMASGIAGLQEDLAEALNYPDDTDPIESLGRQLDDSYGALALTVLIRQMAQFKVKISSGDTSVTELQASELLKELLESIALPRDLKKLPRLDSKAAEIIFQALSLGFGDEAEIGQNHGRALLSKITESMLKAGSYKPSDSGVFIGSVEQHPAYNFKYLIVLGCAEGALPKRVQEDALIPDSLKNSVSPEASNTLRSSRDSNQMAISIIKSILMGSKKLSLSYSRSGLVGTGSGKESPLVKTIVDAKEESVQSYESYIDQNPYAVLESDRARKANVSQTSSKPKAKDLIPELRSAIELHSANFGEFFGNLGVGNQAYKLEDRALSASAVESFLKCPHKFLVTYALGFSFEDDTDEIETYRANDFGTMAHKAWELLLEECGANGTAPEAGEPFSESSKDRFREIFKEQVQSAKNKGQTGWEPLFNERTNQFLNNVDLYFELEHRHRSLTPNVKGKTSVGLRDEFKLRPYLPEYSFDSDGLTLLSIPVPVASGLVTMKFRGAMDRLDLSASGIAAGVLDFKTGKASRIRGGEEEHVQDLLYGYAMRNNAQFPTIQLVTFHYLTMNSEDESELVNMRNLPTELFASQENGGLDQDQLTDLIRDTNLELDALLKSNLARLAQAIIDGRFATNPDSKSFTYCEVCSVIGKTKSKKIAKSANLQVQGVI